MVELFDGDTVALLVLTSGLGWLLVQLGLRSGALALRPPRRRCTRCGSLAERDRECRCSLPERG